MSIYHQPVLLRTAIQYLLENETDTMSKAYVDATFGGGGHSLEMLKGLKNSDQLIAFDKDDDALNNQITDERFTLINADFKYIKKYMKMHKVQNVDAILADIGVSSFQFDTAARGFSFRYDAPLDMRMDQSQGKTAADVLLTYSEEQLKTVLEQYGEITNAAAVANDIVKTRRGKPIESIEELKMVLEKHVYSKPEKYLACVFQALRIEVNGELDALKQLLYDGTELLNKGGRMVIICYHSLEDRMVKQFFKNGCFDDEPAKDEFGNITQNIPMKPLLAKAITPDAIELKSNPRSRSAKMRIGVKK